MAEDFKYPINNKILSKTDTSRVYEWQNQYTQIQCFISVQENDIEYLDRVNLSADVFLISIKVSSMFMQLRVFKPLLEIFLLNFHLGILYLFGFQEVEKRRQRWINAQGIFVWSDV